MPDAARQLIQRYYEAFNAGDMETFLGLLTEDVVHDINQGRRETGREAFRAFMQRMNRNYSEQIVDIVVMSEASGTRVAAAGGRVRQPAGGGRLPPGGGGLSGGGAAGARKIAVIDVDGLLDLHHACYLSLIRRSPRQGAVQLRYPAGRASHRVASIPGHRYGAT